MTWKAEPPESEVLGPACEVLGPVFRVGSKRSKSGETVRGLVDGREVDFVVDSGSDVCLLRKGLVVDESRLKRGKFCIRTVTGEKSRVDGIADLFLQVGPFQREYPFWICDVEDDAILGRNWLRDAEVGIDYRSGCYRVMGSEVPMGRKQSASFRRG